jgi:hypothetical protein
MSDQREQLNEMKKFRQLMEDISEGKERPYVCYHAKKKPYECTADSSYGAAKKAAEAWGMNSTAGISATLADITHSTQFVGEDELDMPGFGYDEEENDDEHYNTKDAEVEEFEGRTVFVTDLYDGDIYGLLDGNRFMLSAPIDRGYGVGNISDDEIEIFDADFSLRPDDEDFLRRWYLEGDEGLNEGDPDDTDWDAHWAREDGDDERADDLEADAEFARMDDELDEADRTLANPYTPPPKRECSECGDFASYLVGRKINDLHYKCYTCGHEEDDQMVDLHFAGEIEEDANDNWGVGNYVIPVWEKPGDYPVPLEVIGVIGDEVVVQDDFGNKRRMFPEDLRLAPDEIGEANFYDIMRTNRDEDDDHYFPKDRHTERPHTPGYDKLGSGAKAAADSRAKAFMVDEDDDPDGMGSYDILWNDESWKEAIPYDKALKEVDRILQIIDDSALQAHDNNDHLEVKKRDLGDSVEWRILDPIDGDHQVVRVEPSDMPAGYTGESVELGSVVENVLQEYPGQPKDYDEGDYDPDEADQREMADDMNRDYGQDEIDPDYEDSELGLRFD